MKDLLVTCGWIRNEPRSQFGFCLLGAAGQVLDIRTSNLQLEPSAWPLLSAVVAAIRARQPVLACLTSGVISPSVADSQVIAHWNDSHAHDIDDVIALLDEALLLLVAPASVPEPPSSEAGRQWRWWMSRFGAKAQTSSADETAEKSNDLVSV